VTVKEFRKIQETTTSLYHIARSTDKDIDEICKHTEINREIITRIKAHLFYQEHRFFDGVRRFDPDCEVMMVWTRLMSNEFVKSDLLFLQHVYVESLVANGTEVSYEEADTAANKLYNWQGALEASENEPFAQPSVFAKVRLGARYIWVKGKALFGYF
jgi:hypothetical protein